MLVSIPAAHHNESLLHELQLGDELLLLQLQLVQSWRGLGPVRLQQVGLLHEVHLQLLLQQPIRGEYWQLHQPITAHLQLRHELLKLLAARVCAVLDQLLQLRGLEAGEGRALHQSEASIIINQPITCEYY